MKRGVENGVEYQGREGRGAEGGEGGEREGRGRGEGGEREGEGEGEREGAGRGRGEGGEREGRGRGEGGEREGRGRGEGGEREGRGRGEGGEREGRGRPGEREGVQGQEQDSYTILTFRLRQISHYHQGMILVDKEFLVAQLLIVTDPEKKAEIQCWIDKCIGVAGLMFILFSSARNLFR